MKNQRGSINKSTSKFLGVWLPDQMADKIDRAVVEMDSDRSKFVRLAIKEKLDREAMSVAA